MNTLLEKNLLPDVLIRWGIRRLLGKRLQQETADHAETQQGRLLQFVHQLKASPIAIHTEAANEQHYEVPTEFFQLVLGPRKKYSGCYWPQTVQTLKAAEEAMLELTVHRARIEDGHHILDMGCGWGSFSLYVAEKFPNSQVTGVSNSRTQREFIEAEAQKRGLTNVTIITANMNEFDTDQKFDRIVSIEMFEHMRNYEKLLAKVSTWMKEKAYLFVHIFCHKDLAYPFEVDGDNDWMARYFFTGGIMPSDHLLLYFQKHLSILDQWAVNGEHYERTSNVWLENMDQHREQLMPLFSKTYGQDQALKWWVYWRVFFMSCAELFGYNDGKEWFVAHYLFEKK